MWFLGSIPPLVLFFSGFLVSFLLLLLGVWCLLMFFLSPSNPSHLSHHISSGLVLLFWCKMWVAGFQFVVLSQAWFIHYTHFFPHFCLLRASFRHPSVRLYCLHCSSQSPTHSSCVFPLLGSWERKRLKIKTQFNSTRLCFLGDLGLGLGLSSFHFSFLRFFFFRPLYD